MASQLSEGHSRDMDDSLTRYDGVAAVENSEMPLVVPLRESIDFQLQWILFVLGCTTLMPWNVLITAMPFFLSRLAGSPFQATFSSYLSTTFLFTDFICLAHATVTSKSTSYARRIRIMIMSLLLLTTILTIGTFVPVRQGTFFKCVLTLTVFAGGITAYLQCSVSAVASIFGPQALQAFMSGQAAVAVAVSIVQLISAVISLSGNPGRPSFTIIVQRPPEETSAFSFFAFSTCFLCLSALAHSLLLKMSVYQTLVVPLERKALARAETTGERQALLAPSHISQGGESIGVEQDERTTQILRVARTNIVYEVAVAYAFIVTFAVFPSITTAIMPTNHGFHPLLFSAIHFVVFNLGDLLGRNLCAFPRLLIWSQYRLLALSLSRTIFIPLFLACNIALPSSSSHSSPLINSDVLFFLILFAFGASGGYVSSLCMISAPSLEHNTGLKDQDDVDTAATIAMFCLVGGLVSGSVASFGIRAFICQCNPFVN